MPGPRYGFDPHFFGPEAGEGILHATEGWLMFVGAFMTLGVLAWVGARFESAVRRRWRGYVRGRHAAPDFLTWRISFLT